MGLGKQILFIVFGAIFFGGTALFCIGMAMWAIYGIPAALALAGTAVLSAGGALYGVKKQFVDG